MEALVLRTPSVGSVVKKVIAIHPDLTTTEIIQMIKQSIQTQGGSGNEFGSAEMIDEEQVLRLARASLVKKNSFRSNDS